ncbi:hypothetical protein FQR65_LT00896 [Abscondita terminalis]|nr:hypothetical protein FQR65_LT00896 [Abscondita terminalis]
MNVLKLVICVLSALCLCCDCARILGIVPTPSYSHQVVFQPIWKALSLRGHQVTTLTTDPINDSTLVNLTEIDLRPSYDIWNKYIADLSASNMIHFTIMVQEVYSEVAHYQLSHPQVQHLLNSDSEKFDLVMVEYSLIPMQAFAKKFNAPLIIIYSMEVYSDMRYLVGCPSHPIANRDPFLTIYNDPTLLQRLTIILLKIFSIFIYFHYDIKQQLIIDQYFGKNYPTIQELNQDISLMLSNSNPVLNGVKPLVPTIVQFGGGTHRTAPKPLPIDLKKILDDATNGFIYFSLGTNIKSIDLPDGTLEIIMQTFKELPYTVLWKFESDDIPNKPKNVITRKWMPQQDILKHPNIKLFITQGGLQSTEEAIYDHVPMLGIPFFADQGGNVANMVTMGFGKSIDYRTINKEEFKTAILEVINNPKYKATIKKLAELALDQPMTGLENAIWWIEYVIRHNGTKHLRSPILDIPFYQYYLLDVIGVFVVVLGIVPTPSYSHQVVFQPIWKALSLRGHQVTTLTTDPINDSTLVNLTEIDLRPSYDIWNKYIADISASTLLYLSIVIQDIYSEIAHYQLSHPQVQHLLNSDSKEFDLVMVEYSLIPMQAFAKKFNAPLVLIYSMDVNSDMRYMMGCPSHPIANRDTFIPVHKDPTLLERLMVILIKIFGTLIRFHYDPKQQLIIDKYFGKNYSTIQELNQDISLMLSNSNPIFNGVKPLVPTIVQFGGGIHRTAPKPLPTDLKKILDEATNGFIYFSLGSNVKSKDLTEGTLEIIMQTFQELPYTILWKFESDDVPNKPKNVITRKWMPQQDILKHPNIKLFITQGGLQSTEEAIYDHVPMLGIPFFGDQHANVANMVSMGFGKSIDYSTITKEELKTAILEVIINPKYKATIKKLAELALDQPMTGLEKAIWWIEYVIRHNGTKHLKSPMLDLPFYQYYLLDVIGVFVVVLGIVPTPSYSHQVAFKPIWKELSLRGHQVTTLTTDPINDSTLVNLTEIDLRPSYDIWNKYIADLSASSMLQLIIALQDIFSEIAHYQLSHPQVQHLLNSDPKEFDLVMVEYSLIPMQAFAKKFNAPLVIIYSMEVYSDMRYMMGCPSHPIANRDPFIPVHKDPTLLERLTIILFKILGTFLLHFHFNPKQQLIIDQYFGKKYPTIEELNNDISLMLSNSNPIFNGVKPLVPTIVQFGGGTHRTSPKPLPTDLKKILDEATNGFIYFSLGSNVKSKDLPDGTLEIIMQTFKELPYTVLWKFELDNLPNKPKNVITRKWMPQQDILKHPKIKLFITQGGLQSTEEAIYDHVPMLGIPFFGDQDGNVANMVSMGFGKSINYRTINKEEFKSAIFEVINNPKYKATIKKLAELALDQPMTGLEKAIWWTEYVLRHNGTKHLRSPMLDIPFYQYYLLDVIGVFVVALAGLIFTIMCFVKLLRKVIGKKKLKVN